ncbi:DUF4440 domain-containing protein [Neobacillus sp. D3-1R]|uniref:DUF4440 domain-containing protein n=1 Tax=Neobacillus sp. D3-1R TaxID=3445778 RepID=UPI003FA10A29
MLKDALNAVVEYRRVINTGNVMEINKWVSDDFIGYVGYYADKDYEVYRGDSYKLDNVETFKSFEGKDPFWKYKDLTHSLRTPNELILSSIVEFYLSGEKVATALAMEVFKKELGEWKLYRQHMEKYAE